MEVIPTKERPMGDDKRNRGPEVRTSLHLRMREFLSPIVRDALVIGTKAPLGAEELRRGLAMLSPHPFVHIPIEDDVISDILCRTSLLRRLTRDSLIRVVLRSVKPFMEPIDVLQLQIDAEAFVEDEV